MKRISWEDSAMLRNNCGDLLDGVVTVVHGHMMVMSVCRDIDDYGATQAFWVVDVYEISNFYGIESSDALRAANWVTAVCFDNESEAMLWFTNNVHKRLLMSGLHDQDLITFLSTIPEQRP